jgi:hypothetical protein
VFSKSFNITLLIRPFLVNAALIVGSGEGSFKLTPRGKGAV